MDSKEWIILVLILSLSFVLFNFSNFNSNWISHPDDQADYLFTEQYHQTGNLGIEINNVFVEAKIYPEGSVLIDSRIVPLKPVGFLILSSNFLNFGNEAVFYFVPFLGVLSLVFIFYFVKEITSTKIALVAIALFALSIFYIAWNNMFFSNVPAFSFFILGIYSLKKYHSYKNNKSLLLLAGLFFAISFFLRYECLVFFLVIIVYFYFAKKLNIKEIILLSLPLIILVATVLLINNRLYNSPFSIGYLEEGTKENIGKENLNVFQRFYNRALSHLIHIDSVQLGSNFVNFVINPLLGFIVISIVGLFLLRNSTKKEYITSLIIISVIWSWFVLNAQYWGFGKTFSINTYTRLLFFPYFLLAISAATFLFKGHYNKKVSTIIFLVSFLSMITIGFYSHGGIMDVIEEKETYRLTDEYIAELPENSVIVGNLFQKGIVSRPSINPFLNLEKEQRVIQTIESVNILLSNDYEVYLIEAPWHQATFLDLKKEFTQGGYNVEKNHEIYIESADKVVEIYKIT